jgi:hypothetical protein
VLLITRKGDSFHMCIFWQAWRKGRSLEFLMLEAFLWREGVHPRWYDSDRYSNNTVHSENQNETYPFKSRTGSKCL